ncbi:MAG: glycerol kinase, partial [Christensenellaceae bacterium]|nr:glycerol kinase [Christensenellaceae bacterium]
MKRYILALDQGTTSSRAILFDREQTLVQVAQREFTQHYPKPGWVEHDAEEILSVQLQVAREALEKARAAAGDIAAIGITNQRETVVVWDKKTGAPICPAIVWQCRRTAEYCDLLRAKGLEPLF